MSLTTSEMTPADIRACTCNNDGYGNGGMWGGDWLAYLLLFTLIGGGGFGGFGGFGGGGILPWLLFGNNGFGGGSCATQADLAAGFNNSAVLSSLNDLKLGQSQGFNGINTAILQTANGIDNAICTLGYQNQAGVNALSAQLAQCCCDTKGAIKDVAYGNAVNTNAIQQQISSCCCDIEKANMQNRFDAQAYNCNTLQAIDKLGDRIESRMTAMENARTRELLDAERTKNAVLQGQIDRAQLRYDIVNDVRPCPQPAYITCNPYAYTNPCNSGCGSF